MATSTAPLTRRYSSADSGRTPPHPPLKMLDFRQVGTMLRNHGEFLSRVNGRDTTTNAGDKFNKEQDLRWPRPFAIVSEGMSGVISGPFPEQANSQRGAAFDENTTADQSSHGRARKLDHRVSLGPEKAWSIGTGESNSRQDGQVEKSITEVLAGVEPNTRSRKASHSLRFFKEGLPEEKGKRKEPRTRAHSRERPSPTAEKPKPTEIRRPPVAEVVSGDVQAARRPIEVPPSGTSRPTRTHPGAARSPGPPPISESPEDYFLLQAKDEQRDESKEVPSEVALPSSEPLSPGSKRSTITAEDVLAREPDSRQNLGDSTEAGESVEDGEDSGEEKISSAVFLPHQRLEEGPEVPVSGPPRLAPGSRTKSRAEDFHPWLVKADDPEVDDQRAEGDDYDASAKPKFDEPTLPSKEPSSRAVDEVPALVEEPEPVLQLYEDHHVHEHQLTPKQPLEAIELIPYKHQVGGHTTIWRFSKRAVCKQLNNRENEFYETVEKYHRDLLAFLPRYVARYRSPYISLLNPTNTSPLARYIGVLNVTFQKRNRRKSTARRDEQATQERKLLEEGGVGADLKSSGGQAEPMDIGVEMPKMQNGHTRVISQSLQSTQLPVPTVTFVDNQHILPRNLLQPSQPGLSIVKRFRSTSASVQEMQSNRKGDSISGNGRISAVRPSLEERHANSWGATTVNKRLRNEVFNDAFLKNPITIQRHRRAHHRSLPRRAIPHATRPAATKPVPINARDSSGHATDDHYQRQGNPQNTQNSQNCQSGTGPSHTPKDAGQQVPPCEQHEEEGEEEEAVKDVTGTSAPEPELPVASPPSQRRKRRHSGSALRRKPKDFRESRGDLVYFEEADEAGYKGDNEQGTGAASQSGSAADKRPSDENSLVHHSEAAGQPDIPSAMASTATSPTAEFKIPRPINPKEAQTQRDSWVEYFLLLEDLTAGMKRPCIMDLKMGTRQYGVDANPNKQKSQQGKCAKTTSRKLGVRVCGLQVWDVKTQSYIFQDKYFGRDLKAGQEFQDALTRFLYDGVELSSILRHIPTVLQKIDELEVIIRRLRGYRFYAASLLMFYDGDVSGDGNDTAADDYSTTDFATDTEEPLQAAQRRANKGQIDFKMADFANSVTAGELSRDKPCPPQHPDEPDRGFLMGLRSLRKYFLRIQRDTRAELGLGSRVRNGLPDDIDLDVSEDEGGVSE